MLYLKFQLPKADLFVWEEFPSILPKDPYVSAKISSLVLQSYLVSIINQTYGSGQVGIVGFSFLLWKMP